MREGRRNKTLMGFEFEGMLGKYNLVYVMTYFMIKELNYYLRMFMLQSDSSTKVDKFAIKVLAIYNSLVEFTDNISMVASVPVELLENF